MSLRENTHDLHSKCQELAVYCIRCWEKENKLILQASQNILLSFALFMVSFCLLGIFNQKVQTKWMTKLRHYNFYG